MPPDLPKKERVNRIMSREDDQSHAGEALDDGDRVHITGIFHEDIAPRLMKMGARTGSITCEFAGEQYKNWLITFKSARSGFKIVDFEYDEDARTIQLVPRGFREDMQQPGRADKNV